MAEEREEEENDDSSVVSSDSEEFEKPEEDDLRYDDPHYLEDERDLNKLGGIMMPERQAWITGNARLLVEPERIDVKRQRRMAPKAMHGADYFVQAGEWLFTRKGISDDEFPGVIPMRSCLSGVVIPKNVPDAEVPNYFWANFGYKGLATERSFGATRHWSYLEAGKGASLNTGNREIIAGDLVAIHPCIETKTVSISGFPKAIIKRKPWVDKIRRIVSTTTPLQYMDDFGVFPDRLVSCVLRAVLEKHPNLDLTGVGGSLEHELTNEQNVAIERKIKHLFGHMDSRFRKEIVRLYQEDNLTLNTRVGASVRCTATSNAKPGEPFFCIVHPASSAILSANERLKMELAKSSSSSQTA